MDGHRPDPAAFISLENITVKTGGALLLDQVSLTVYPHQQWAIIGSAGSGKSTLAQVLARKIFYSGLLTIKFSDSNNRVELVQQQHRFKNLHNTSHFYYQQRFNASEASDSMSVETALGNYTDNNNWIGLLQLDALLQTPLLQLSNGENKRLQLAKALLSEPALLVLDCPFTGLDALGRETLQNVFNTIVSRGIHLVLITGAAALPDCITHVAVLENGRIISAQKKEHFLQQPVQKLPEENRFDKALLQQLQSQTYSDFDLAVKMTSVSVRYGDKIILDGLNWQVKKGECWNVAGPNGAGKSTLLSLITADNPQAYSNDIILFDKQRGSGESIWDIKAKIGFVSPELHLHFEQQATCFEVIASGLFDTIGLFRRITATQEETVVWWMRLMRLEAFQHKRIFQLSASQQRMSLLARALVKNPPLLILDEPTQGLDEAQMTYFTSLVNEICIVFNTTLIYVSHYTTDLPACINHHLQLNKGKSNT